MILVSIILTNCPPQVCELAGLDGVLQTRPPSWAVAEHEHLFTLVPLWGWAETDGKSASSDSQDCQGWFTHCRERDVCCVCVYRLAIKHLCSAFHLSGSLISFMMFSYFHHFSQPHLRLPVRAVCEWWWTLSRPITSVPSVTLSSVNSCRSTTTPHQQSTTPSSAIWRCVYVRTYV